MIKSSVVTTGSSITTSSSSNNRIIQKQYQTVPIEIEIDDDNDNDNDDNAYDESLNIENGDTDETRIGQEVEELEQEQEQTQHQRQLTFLHEPSVTFLSYIANCIQQRYTIYHFGELLICFFFLLFVYITTSGYPYPIYQRPIPYQSISLSNNNSNIDGISSSDVSYFIKDLTINESLTPNETVTKIQLMHISFYYPFILQLILSLLFGQKDDVHGTICVYVLSYALVSTCKELLKNYIGYLRPIFYSLCHPSTIDYGTCQTAGSHSERGGHRSCPSGHASTAFIGLTLLSLYIHTRFGSSNSQTKYLITQSHVSVHQQQQQQQGERQDIETIDSNDVEDANTTGENDTLEHSTFVVVPNTTNGTYQRYGRIVVSLLSLVPIGIASFIAVSRVYDNKHFPADIVAGSIIGASVSMFVHGLWII